MANVRDVVFIHGWGLNSAIWNDYAALLRAANPALTTHQIDLPGYGHLAGLSSSAEISELAISCLQQAPDKALWVGWSLGGMVAMQAALLDQGNRIQGLQLLNTTPKFVRSQDWPTGVDVSLFQKFCDQLSADYQRTLTLFLLLQAGTNKGARELARAAHSAVCQLMDPSPETLQMGIDCLANTDLRTSLSALNLPVQVVSGVRDRVTNHGCSTVLAQCLDAELVEMDCGHAPFLTNQAESLSGLLNFIASINSSKTGNSSKSENTSETEK